MNFGNIITNIRFFVLPTHTDGTIINQDMEGRLQGKVKLIILHNLTMLISFLSHEST